MKNTFMTLRKQHPVLLGSALCFVALLVAVGAAGASTYHPFTHGCEKPAHSGTASVCGIVHQHD